MLRLSTLGEVAVWKDDEPVPELPAQRLRCAVLVYLAVERSVLRDDLLAIFWPDRDSSRGRHALRQLLYELRRVLGTDWLEAGRDRLLVRDLAVDTAAFESAADAGQCDAAIALYRGSFLRGFSVDNAAFEAWADRRRAHYGRLYRRLQRQQLAARLDAGDLPGALALARQWVAADPLDDDAAHALIELLAAAGERAEALRFYDTYEAALVADLEVEPLDETRALVARIRAGDIVADRTPDTLTRPAQPPSPAPADQPRDRDAPARRRRAPLMRAYVAGAAALALLLAALAFAARPGRDVLAGGTLPPRIAVLPFEDRTADPALRLLADALAEKVARGLARSATLEVMAPTGVRWLRERGTPQDSLVRLLNANFLVAGTLTRVDDRLQVEVELLDARDGRIIRGSIVERPWDDSHVLIEDVVSQLATLLRRDVGAWIDIRQIQAGTTSEEAWRLVLEGRSTHGEPVARLLRQNEFDAAHRELARADSLLERAAQVDRRWPAPLVERGWVLARRAFVARIQAPGDIRVRRELLVSGLAMADRALERDAGYAAAFELRGVLLYELALQSGLVADSVRAGLGRAEVALRQATVLEPQRQRSWRTLAEVLSQLERYAESKNAALRAYQLDPFESGANALVNLLFTTSLELGEDGDAETWCTEGGRRFVNELPFLYCRFALHAWADGVRPSPALLRRELAAVPAAQLRAQPQLQPRLEALVAAAYARAGGADSARAILERLGSAPPDPALLWLRAAVHAALGEDAEAVALLEAYLQRGPWSGPRVARGRAFASLREDARYRQLFMAVP